MRNNISNQEDFWNLARERYSILLKRRAGAPRPWSDCPLLNIYHVCNVFRDDDAVSNYIMNKMLPNHKGQEYRAAILGRLINNEVSLHDLRLTTNLPSVSELSRDIAGITLNTNAYKINTPNGLNNRAGIVELYRRASERNWREDETLQDGFDQITSIGIRPFIAYQVAQDLRGTVLPLSPCDEMTWSYFGIGAIRGAIRICGYSIRDYAEKNALQNAKDGMRGASLAGGGAVFRMVKDLGEEPYEFVKRIALEVLGMARDEANWSSVHPQWTLSTVEHMLCEYDKICRWREIGPGAGARRFKGV